MDEVVSGLERWIEQGPRAIGLERGARLGILAHPASVDRQARHLLELLENGGEFRPVRLFAPEHGLFGHEQDMEQVRPGADTSSGLPVVSLYGADADSLRPAPDDLTGLDALVVDLQDVGSRYYTFIYTLSFVMEAAAEAGLPVVVLDRPNPLGGEAVEGPVLHPELSSFVGRYPLPVRHGLTIGELATLFNEVHGIGCSLHVVRMAGWRRGMSFEQTGLPWVPPSPNMPTPATARVYPGGCLIEGTNLSEGRGTTTPFELTGAPWLDGVALARQLRAESLPGVLFRAASFRPVRQKHAGRDCHGVQVIVTDWRAFRPFESYLVLLREARAQSRHQFGWRSEAYEFETSRLAIDLLLGRGELRPLLESGATLKRMESLWADDLREFNATRRRFLLYD